MSPIKSMLAAIMLASATIIVAVPQAIAQGTTVITVDEGRVLRDSRAGKDLSTKLKNIEAQVKRELEPTINSLKSEGTSLQSQTNGKTNAQLAADTALVSRIQAYQKKAEDFGRKRNTAGQELALTERKARQEFGKLIGPVLEEVMREKNAQMIVARGSVIFASPSIDATQAVISKLDSRSPTVNVTRQRLPSR